MRASEPSSTALLIARCLLLAEATPTLRPLLPPHAAEITRQFLTHAPRARLLDFALRHASSRRLLLALEHVVLPGIIRHYLVRKRCIETHVRDFLHQHPDAQVVVLGAGLDTLAWRLAATNAASAFELDRPATQAVTRRTNLSPAPHLIALDLARDCPAAALAKTSGYSPAKPTLFVAEGLLMYFRPGRVGELLAALARAAHDSRLVFTFLERRPNQALGFRGGHCVIDAWLRWRSEPFEWGEDRANLPGFLQDHGWTLSTLTSAPELRERFLSAPERRGQALAEGEAIALARRA